MRRFNVPGRYCDYGIYVEAIEALEEIKRLKRINADLVKSLQNVLDAWETETEEEKSIHFNARTTIALAKNGVK